MSEPIRWLSTKEAASRLGVTLRSLYRFIDEGDLVAYKFGRVIRIQEPDVDRFIEASRIQPGGLEHLYPEVKGSSRPTVDPDGSTPVSPPAPASVSSPTSASTPTSTPTSTSTG